MKKEEEIEKIKYWVCCPLCDNDKCVKDTDKCEAEKWEKVRNNYEITLRRKLATSEMQ